MNHGGEKYQIQTFGFSSANSGAGSTITGGVIPGVLMNTTNGWMGNLLATGATLSSAGVLRTYGDLNEQNEWLQPQNGSGRTEWDGADVLTQSHAQKALSALDGAITKKDGARANLGAIQNRLENTITTLQIQAENLQAAESRISDVDVATEMTEFTRNNILAQAAVAMLAQANSLPQLALSLIR
jgi:flagellin